MMELHVHKVQQAASGGSHVTIFDADIEFSDNGVQVEIIRADSKADAADVEAARSAIRRGAERVLQPLGMGAIIRVGRLVVHAVDFKPKMFERYTAEELAQVLAATKS
jgi:hypothetical protein